MDTKRMMDMALELAGLDAVPADSGIFVEGESIKRVLVGIDMETPELMLAKELGYDCVVGHHPNSDMAALDFVKVMERQIDVMTSFGVPINRAQKALKKRMLQVDMAHHVGNYDRTSSAARIIGMPYMNIHLPADMIGERIVQKYLDERFADSPKKKLSDVMAALNEFDAYKGKIGGPKIRVGGDNDYAGRIAVLMAGGTSGGADVFKSYFDAGVGTIVCMHVPEDVKKAVEEQNIGNIIVAGHMLSDSVGMNAIIEKWEGAGLEVTSMSGIIRV